jgi:hypothetical protein
MTTKGYDFGIFKEMKSYKVSILAICANCSNTWKETYTTNSPVIANSTTYQYCSKCYDEEKGEVTSGRSCNTKI